MTGVPMRLPKPLPTTILFAGLLSLGACQHKQEVSNLPIKQYELHGRVMSLNPQTQGAVINGQKIEGWMGAMTMEYPVKAESDFQKLRPGEQISATVYVQGMNYWIGGIRPQASTGQ